MAALVLIDIDEAKALAFTGEGLVNVAEVDRFASRRRLAARIEARIDRRMEQEVQVTFNPGAAGTHMIEILDNMGVLSGSQAQALHDHVAAEIANDGWLVHHKSVVYLLREVDEAQITEEEVAAAEAYHADLDAACDTDKRAIATLNANFDRYSNDGAMWQRRALYWERLRNAAEELRQGLEWEARQR